MRNGNDVNRVRQHFIDKPVTKSDDATGASRPIVKWESLGIVLNPGQSHMHRVEESVSQVFALAFVVLSSSHEFDIRLAMINDRRHEIARNASRITSWAGRTFALPE